MSRRDHKTAAAPRKPTQASPAPNVEPPQRCSTWVDRWLPPLVLAIIGLGLYWNSFDVPFLFDDKDVISSPYIKQLWPIWEAARAEPHSPTAGRPVVAFSLAVNYALGGLHVRGYHVFNLIFHVLNSWLLFGIVRRTLLSERWNSRFPGQTPTFLAFATAALWLVHPLQTEAVTYIIQRTELLMGLFYLLTLYTAIRAWNSSRPWLWNVLCIACCTLGMASKEVMVSAPIMVVLYDLAFRDLRWRELLARRWTLYLALACTWAVLGTLMILDPRSRSVGFHLSISVWRCMRTESWAVLRYLQLAVWPDGLSFDYGPWFDVTSAQAVAGVITVATLVSVTLWGWARHAWLGFLGTWVLLILAPTTSIVPIMTEPVAERRMYLPLAALAVFTTVVIWQGGQRVHRRVFPAGSKGVWPEEGWGLVALFTLGGVLGTLTIDRNQDYQSALIAWTDTLYKQPGNNRAYTQCRVEMRRANRPFDAAELLREAVQQNPSYAEARSNLGAALIDLGEFQAALVELDQAIALKPELHYAHHYRGLVLQHLGQFDEAMREFQTAVELAPQDVPSLCDFAVELARHGDYERAIEYFQRAMPLSPENPSIHYHLAQIRAKQGNRPAALEHYREAARLKPEDAEPPLQIGKLLSAQGNTTEAALWFEKVLKIDPKNQAAQEGLKTVTPPTQP